MSDRVVLLFTKPSQPGRVKTRLIGDLSAEDAARLHAAFVADLLDRLRGGSYELRMAWALESGERPPESDLASISQQGADLGQRLHHALKAVAGDNGVVAAIGSDHPELECSDLEEAFDVLESGKADVVLGPALDGGYYLVALRADSIHEDLFDGIPWSTPQVLEETLARCRALALRTFELHSASDVDTPADLVWLASELAAGRVNSPQTAGLLRSWGRLSRDEPEEGVE